MILIQLSDRIIHLPEPYIGKVLQFIFKTLIEKLLREIKKAIHTHGEKDCKKKKKKNLTFPLELFF